MHIFITGGTGFIGSALVPCLIKHGHTVSVLTRQLARAKQKLPVNIALINNINALESLPPIDVIINLAGHPIANGPWFSKTKKAIVASRVDLTGHLMKVISQSSKHNPKLLLSGSAVGYYGLCENEILTEDSPVGTGFAADLCRDWESKANEAAKLGMRICTIRTGLVLGNGGLLKRMRLPFLLCLGGKIGQGKQWMSWIHIQDYLNIILYCITHETMQGPINATAPNPVTNQTLTQTYAKVLKRPAFMPAPAFLLKTVLGQMAEELLLSGQRVIPKKLLDAGFVFEYPELMDALLQIEKRLS